MSQSQPVENLSIAQIAANLTNSEIKRQGLTGKPADKLAESIGDLAVTAAEQIYVTEKKAGKDQLTGAYNRFGLQTRLKEMIAQPSKFFDDRNEVVGKDVLVMVIDLDFFKKFNDKYGHGAGDVVLRNFAQILMGSIRKGDILLRYGGEEFCLFLFGNQVDNSHEVFEIIDKRLTDLEMEYQGNKLNKINFSAGATIVPWERMKEIADSPEDQLPLIIANVCQPADQALYQAKKQGRGQLVVASE